MSNQENFSLATETIHGVVDEGSFIEVNSLMKNSNVVTGYATIDGKLVYIYSQYGSINEHHCKKIIEIYSMALKMGAPIIGVLNSDGIEIEEGLQSLDLYGKIFSVMSNAKGIIPQISIISGECYGANSLLLGLTDFVFGLVGKSKLLLNSPINLDGSESKILTIEDMSNGEVHSKNGLIDFIFNNKEEMFISLRKLVTILPSNNLDSISINCEDDLNRLNGVSNNILDTIKDICDNKTFIEVTKDFGVEMITGFGSLNGDTIGIIANNGDLTKSALEKATKFIKFCDSFSVKILTITDVKKYSFESSAHSEFINKLSQFILALSSATVGKVNVILHNAIGSPMVVMNSKSIGADIVYAWNDANVEAMTKESLKKVMDIEVNENLQNAGELGLIDKYINPEETRKHVIYAFEMLLSKRMVKPLRKAVL